jgi:hypothetical protein
MFEALMIVALLGLAWTLVGGLVLARRVQALERALHQDRVEVASRLEDLEGLARDRWLAEAASLGGQVTAMIETLETTARQSRGEMAEQMTQVTLLLQQADEARARLADAIEQASRSPADPTLAVRRAPTLRSGPATLLAPTAPPATSEKPDAAVVPPRPAPPLAARRREARRLAAEGLAPVEIARRTGLGVAEIDLMLRLGRPAPLQRSA